MNNTVIVVGRLVRYPELQLTESGKKISTITLAVPRTYKNVQGEYETDFLDCTLWTGVAESTAEYCKTGDVIGIKGRLQSRIIEKEDGSKYKKMEIVAEKVNFIASSKKNQIDTENIDKQDEGEVIAEFINNEADEMVAEKVSKAGKKRK